MRSSDREHVAFVREVFLPHARTQVAVPREMLDQLAAYAWRLEESIAPVTAGATTTALPPHPAAPQPAVVPAAPRTPAPRVTTTPVEKVLTTPIEQILTAPAERVPVQAKGYQAPPPREPGPLARWWDGAKGQIGSDLAAHGLAYLGVLLMFVGAFGLVAFAFGDVAETVRPVAEISIAAVPFLAAWMLLRRGAEIAGRALELAGGLLLPIMLITSFLDGVPFPPDLVGPALVVATTAVSLLVAAAYWLWSRRHATSALRFLVAPLLWFAAGLAVTGVGRPIPTGAGFAVITATQVAAITVAMALTLLLARVRPSAPLASPTRTAARIGVVVVGLLALLTWVGQGVPVVPVIVTGVAGAVALELLGLDRWHLPLAWWSVSLVALLLVAPAQIAFATIGVIGVIGYGVLVELAGRRAQPLGTQLAALGLVGVQLATWADPWWAFGTMAVLSVLVGVRRLHPYAVPSAAPLLDIVAGAASIAAVVAFGLATRDAPLAVLVAAVLVLCSLAVLGVPRLRALLTRDERDHFWQTWWDVGMAATVIAAIVMTTVYWPDVVTARWQLACTPAVLAVSAALGPLPRWVRFPTAAVLLVWSWLVVATLEPWTAITIATPLIVLGLALVVAAQLVPQVFVRLWSVASVGWTGHALGAAAIVVAAAVGSGPHAWLVVAAIAALAAGLVVTVVACETVGSAVLAPLPPEAAEIVVPVLHVAAVGAVLATVVTALDTSGVVPLDSAWHVASVSALALVCALITRLRVSPTLRLSLTWLAVVGSVVGAAAAGAAMPALLGLVVVVLVPLALAPAYRPEAPVWLAWAAVAPIVGLLLDRGVAAYADLAVEAQVAAVLVAVGGVLLVGALALDLRGRAWTTVVVPRRTLLAPAALGALEVAAALLVTTSAHDVAGWVTLAAAVVVLAAGLLARVWSALGVAALLAWIAWWELAFDLLLPRPWISLVCTVVLLAAAEAASRLAVDRRAWVRGDLPLLLVAHVTAATAFVSALGTSALAQVLLALALLSALLAWRLRTARAALAAYGLAGALLLVAAGAVAGPGWLALALLTDSLACSAVATRVRGALQLWLVLVGSLLSVGAWLSFATWLDLSAHARVDWTAMLAAVVLLVGAVLLRRTHLDQLVLLVRLAVAFVAVVAAPLAAGPSAVGHTVELLSLWTATGMLVAAVSAGLAARAVNPALRFIAVLLGLTALFEAFVVVEPSAWWQLAVLGGLTVLTAAGLLVWRRPVLLVWRQPVALLGWLTAFAGLVVAALQLPDTALFPVALVVSGVYSAAYGVAERQLAAQLAAPPLLALAWMTWASNALEANPQWYTVPVGLAVLANVGLLRHRARLAGERIDPEMGLFLDLTGVLFLVGASFVQSITVSLAYAALAAVIGAGVTVWGLLTQVRHRLLVGAGVVIAALVVLVLVPLARIIPAWSSAMLWVVIGCAGLLALLSATLLEQGRAVVRRGLDDLHRLTEGWE